jgi:hypothetical protein
MKNMMRIAATATMLTTGLGLGSFEAAQAMPGTPLLDYHWCPGQFFDPGWGFNWDGNRCHDDFYYDGEPRDAAHWHGNGPWQPGR